MNFKIVIDEITIELNETWSKALELKAKAEEVTVKEIIEDFTNLVKELWENCEYIDKFGRWKGEWIERNGEKKIVIDNVTEGRLELNFEEFVRHCLYYYLRPYILATILQETGGKGSIILREDEMIIIDKKGLRKVKRIHLT